MTKTTTAAKKAAAKTTTAVPVFKIGQFVTVKGQKVPCEIAEKHKTKAEYKVYVKNATFTMERSEFIKAADLKAVKKEA